MLVGGGRETASIASPRGASNEASEPARALQENIMSKDIIKFACKRHRVLPAWAAGLTVAVLAPPAFAAVVITSSFEFTATVVYGPFAGESGAGTVTYNPAAIQPAGEDWLSPDGDPDFKLTFRLFGQDFDETDDPGYSFLPEVRFDDGVPVHLDFYVEEGASSASYPPVVIDEPGVFNFSVNGELTPRNAGVTSAGFGFGPMQSGESYDVQLIINGVVPEPSGTAFAAMAGLGLGGLAFARWRQRRSAR